MLRLVLLLGHPPHPQRGAGPALTGLGRHARRVVALAAGPLAEGQRQRGADLRDRLRAARRRRPAGGRPAHGRTQQRLRRDRRRRRLHRDQRSRRRERDPDRGRPAVCGDRRRPRPIDPRAARPHRRGADRRDRPRDRHRGRQDRGEGLAGAGVRRFGRAAARAAGAGVRQPARARLVGDARHRQRRGAPADPRRPDDLHPDGCPHQSREQRRRAGGHRRPAGRHQHA